jgi:hypothetical protein
MIDAQRQSILTLSVNQLANAANTLNHPANRPPLLIMIDAPFSSRLSRHTRVEVDPVLGTGMLVGDRGCSVLDGADDDEENET